MAWGGLDSWHSGVGWQRPDSSVCLAGGKSSLISTKVINGGSSSAPDLTEVDCTAYITGGMCASFLSFTFSAPCCNMPCLNMITKIISDEWSHLDRAFSVRPSDTRRVNGVPYELGGFDETGVHAQKFSQNFPRFTPRRVKGCILLCCSLCEYIL